MLHKLNSSALKIQQCVYDESAAMRYDIMSDSLVWTDEIPPPPLGDAMVIRLLLRYRTTVLIGQPEIGLAQYWTFGQSLFPIWPGFRTDRNTPTQDKVDYFLSHSRTENAEKGTGKAPAKAG